MFDQANVTARGGGGTSMTTKLIAGAAGFAAMNYYQNYQKKQGKTVHYAFLKKMVAGVAMAQAVKMFNKNTQGGSGFMGMGGKRDIEASREAVAAEAAANAMKLVDEQYGNQYGSGPNVPQGPGSYNPPNQGGGYGGNQGGYGQPPSYSSGPQGGSFGGDYKDPQGGYGGNQGGYGGNQGGYGGNQGNQGGYGGNQGYPPQPGFPGQGNPPSNNPPGPGGFIDPSQRRY
ncbi:hypothetical protein K502DRAFT_176814 [Neoconidiobolus thromboides FSU 785]|nr:hypothetical protein K502DRAFT_176814 [Neoconidiobolus thromboides FSU 785]